MKQMTNWFRWLAIWLLGGFLWTLAFKLYNRMEDLRPAGGFRNYTWYFHKELKKARAKGMCLNKMNY